jgi:DNA-binding PadR family transcriptional regulator
MSVTRMLVLGAVRIFQPTHGYFVRRELTSWQVSEWAHLNPGSVYNALRQLTREQMLAEEPAGGPDAEVSPASREAARVSAGSAPKTGLKTMYRLTVDGEQEFQRLVRVGLWELHPYEPGWLLGGMAMWGVLSREEVLAAMEARAALLTARISATRFGVSELAETAAGTPDHIAEAFHFHAGQLAAELAWAGEVSQRIRAGAYGFRGEDPARQQPARNPVRPPD